MGNLFSVVLEQLCSQTRFGVVDTDGLGRFTSSLQQSRGNCRNALSTWMQQRSRREIGTRDQYSHRWQLSSFRHIPDFRQI